MAETFISVDGQTVTEKTIEKSRFIATSSYIEGEEQAKAFIESVRKRYSDATHNCYAYIADEKGSFMRFSDDGEPQGTAGMPMLEVIKNNKLKKIAVVVTRYFGGIKLGAGGLVRAYAGSVADNLAVAAKVCYQPCVESAYTVDDPYVDAVLRYIGENDCTLSSTEYADKVRFIVAVKSSLHSKFEAALINRLNGRVEREVIKEYLFPFPV